MNIAYLTIILLTITFFTLHKKPKEMFTSKYSNTINKLKNEVKQLNMKYIDIHSKVMSNYKFICPKKDIIEPDTIEAEIIEAEENAEIKESIDKIKAYFKLDTDKESDIRQQEQEPIVIKPQRLQYDILDMIVDDHQDDLEDIVQYQETTESPKDNILNNYLKCYNK